MCACPRLFYDRKKLEIPQISRGLISGAMNCNLKRTASKLRTIRLEFDMWKSRSVCPVCNACRYRNLSPVAGALAELERTEQVLENEKPKAANAISLFDRLMRGLYCCSNFTGPPCVQAFQPQDGPALVGKISEKLSEIRASLSSFTAAEKS
jgi:hypothetical protein